MNRTVTKFLPAFCSTLFRSVSVVLVVLTILFAASSAKAGCGDPRKSGPAPTLSWLYNSNSSRSQDNDGANLFPTIVGLWHVKYTADDGSPFLESFKTWHADGTEFENAFLPPSAGNICFGVWKGVAPRSVRLHHTGLNFNPDGSISGSFTFDETDTVSLDGKTYKGSFDFKTFDAEGNPGVEIKGTMLGTRITVS
jgi:hypothetical protein